MALMKRCVLVVNLLSHISLSSTASSTGYNQKPILVFDSSTSSTEQALWLWFSNFLSTRLKLFLVKSFRDQMGVTGTWDSWVWWVFLVSSVVDFEKLKQEACIVVFVRSWKIIAETLRLPELRGRRHIAEPRYFVLCYFVALWCSICSSFLNNWLLQYK